MNSELVKNVILRRASKFVGTSIADSFTVKRRYSRLICRQLEFVNTVIQDYTLRCTLGNKGNQQFAYITCSSHCAETGGGKTIAGFVPEPAKSCLLGTESLLP